MFRLLVSALVVSGALFAQGRLASLKTVSPPAFTGIERYVQDREALARLGKVFFWDMQAGSDGRTACASCHFHAGADHRRQNQLSGAGAPLNYTLTRGDFPFRLLADVTSNRSAVLRDRRWAAGSAGVVARAFVDVILGSEFEESTEAAENAFVLDGIHLRQVTARNTPSVINSVFNVRNFWDGRARTVFTGLTPFGESDLGLNAWVMRDGELVAEPVRVENSSLASQANGPALNEVEMSYAGRTWEKLARKLLAVAPLARQRVAADDSLLGELANADDAGLKPEFTYAGLIEAAFKAEYRGSAEQMERNFPLYWGLAQQAYQARLIADDSRYDQFQEGRRDALSALEQRGLQLFASGQTECFDCHGGPELTAAGFSSAARNTSNPRAAGFFRVGISPVAEDMGLGTVDGFGLPLMAGAGGQANGVFKAPSLRNVELTGPYFHNGSQATLEQVVEFYGRNGDFQGENLAAEIGRIRMNAEERRAVVAFLKALTDERVRYQRAPFDHPSLCIPVGQGEEGERWALVEEVGRGGGAAPLQTFEELLDGVGEDGSRANTLRYTCRP